MKYYQNIDPAYLELCKTFDPQNQYAVPYFWGTLGILYNEEMVEEVPDSWAVLWDEKYKNQILMQNSMRDAFLVPLKWKGLSVNTDKKEDLLLAQKLLIDQKPLVEAYLVDEIRDAMIAGDAAIAVTYSGDATEAMTAKDNLQYVVPKEGSNIWFDCWIIPDCAKHKKEAEAFIDFMNREDVAAMNFDYIYYATPNKAVYDALDEETKEDETIFPPKEVIDKCEVYQYLGTETDRYYTRLWKELKSK
jgi:spermidine/putrescine-binding protein